MKEQLFLILFLIVLTSACDTLCQLFLKSSINSLKFSVNSVKKVIIFILKLAVHPGAWIALTFSIAALFLWLFVLSKADLNFAFSVGSLHYIFIAFASKLILKEKVGITRWLGTISIVIGIILVAIS